MSALRQLTMALSPPGPALGAKDLISDPEITRRDDISSMEEEQMRAEMLRLRRELDARTREVDRLRSTLAARAPPTPSPEKRAAARAPSPVEPLHRSIWPGLLDAARAADGAPASALDVSAMLDELSIVSRERDADDAARAPAPRTANNDDGAAVAEQRLAEQRLTEQRLAEQRLAEQRLAEQRIAEQRLAEQRRLAIEQHRCERIAFRGRTHTHL